jgi:hypothetical protein
MRHKTVEQPDKVSSLVPCPGCGDLAPSEKWQKDGYKYESLTCVKCGDEWGRIVGRSSTWHILWRVDSDGLKISRKPR